MSFPVSGPILPLPSAPDPRWHKRISIAKSALRIFGYFALAGGSLQGAGALLLLAEILGIAEEMV
jgi:hypothetical protein